MVSRTKVRELRGPPHLKRSSVRCLRTAGPGPFEGTTRHHFAVRRRPFEFQPPAPGAAEECRSVGRPGDPETSGPRSPSPENSARPQAWTPSAGIGAPAPKAPRMARSRLRSTSQSQSQFSGRSGCCRKVASTLAPATSYGNRPPGWHPPSASAPTAEGSPTDPGGHGSDQQGGGEPGDAGVVLGRFHRES